MSDDTFTRTYLNDGDAFEALKAAATLGLGVELTNRWHRDEADQEIAYLAWTLRCFVEPYADQRGELK